jgi:hypothetical protein
VAWLTLVVLAAMSPLALAHPLPAEQAPGIITSPAAKAEAVMAYWTAERMAAAKPLPLPERVWDPEQQARATAPQPPLGPPGFAPGWNPNSGLEPPDPLARFEITPGDPNFSWYWADHDNFLRAASPTLCGTPPANPVDYYGYGKFARWTWYGNYLTFPTSTIGRLFFTVPGVGDGSCSATVAQRSTIITAGHCVISKISGTPTWHTNFLFCPSYYRGSGSGAPHPSRGCWAGVIAATTGAWGNHENLDRDYACIVTATTGTVHANKLGNVTGWAGRAWNWGDTDLSLAWGYPAAAPFPGYHIIVVAAHAAYSVNMSSTGETPDLSSKYIGSDMTPGCSGGSWWFGSRHPNAAYNYADTDGVNFTGWVGADPFIAGLNSHRRCLVNCSSPPSSTQGIFWQEMGSPVFTSNGSDPGDSEDVFATCLSHANNNP